MKKWYIAGFAVMLAVGSTLGWGPNGFANDISGPTKNQKSKAERNKQPRVEICHKGKTKRVPLPALAAHLDHRDLLCACGNASLELKNLIVDIQRYDPTSGRAGAFDFWAGETENKVFLEFGAVVGSPTGDKILPTFEYRVASDAIVYAPIDGVVTGVTFQSDSGDYEIWLE